MGAEPTNGWDLELPSSLAIEPVPTPVVAVAEPEVKPFFQSLEKLNFFEQPSEVKLNKTIFGGSIWILEIADKGKYHVMVRNNPAHRKGREQFLKSCNWLIRNYKETKEAKNLKEKLQE